MKAFRGQSRTFARMTVAIVALLFLSGCDPEAAPQLSNGAGGSQSPPPASSSSAKPTCTISSTTLGSSSYLDVITVARRMVNRGGHSDSETLYNQRYRPDIVWSTPSNADSAAIMILLGVTSGDSPGLDRVEAFLAGVDKKEDATIIGYAGVREESRPLNVACSEGHKLTGVLKTWTDAEIGAVGCAQRPQVDAPKLAHLAYGYCFE